MKKIAIFGAGGLASEIADICDALDYEHIVYILQTQREITDTDSTTCFLESDVLNHTGFVGG